MIHLLQRLPALLVMAGRTLQAFNVDMCLWLGAGMATLAVIRRVQSGMIHVRDGLPTVWFMARRTLRISANVNEGFGLLMAAFTLGGL